MHRHPTRDTHTDRAELDRGARGLLTGPATRVGKVSPKADVFFDHAAVDAIAAGQTHHHAIQVFDVAPHVHAVRVQIQNRITDELPRRVRCASQPKCAQLPLATHSGTLAPESTSSLRRLSICSVKILATSGSN